MLAINPEEIKYTNRICRVVKNHLKNCATWFSRYNSLIIFWLLTLIPFFQNKIRNHKKFVLFKISIIIFEMFNTKIRHNLYKVIGYIKKMQKGRNDFGIIYTILENLIEMQ